jgi:lysophospholipid acyltransferase
VEAGRALAPTMLYEGMTVRFLADECVSRDIETPPKARKAELIALLRDADAVDAAFAAGFGSGPPLLSAALARMFQAVPFAILYLVHMRFFPFSRVLAPEFALLPAWHRVLYSWVSVRTFGLRFPFAWLLAEAACIGSGVAFSGYETKAVGKNKTLCVARFNAARNIIVREVEFATDLPAVLRNWNISVHQWVKDYVYVRVVKRTRSRLAAQVATFATLAYWHGTRPGYYMYFLSVPLLVACAERLGKVTAHFLSPAGHGLLASGPGSVLHAVGGWLLTQTAIAYLSAAFIALGFDDTVRAWSLVGWYGHIGAVLLIIASYSILPGRPERSSSSGRTTAKAKKE